MQCFPDEVHRWSRENLFHRWLADDRELQLRWMPYPTRDGSVLLALLCLQRSARCSRMTVVRAQERANRVGLRSSARGRVLGAARWYGEQLWDEDAVRVVQQVQ
jgi:hypothetical protein